MEIRSKLEQLERKLISCSNNDVFRDAEIKNIMTSVRGALFIYNLNEADSEEFAIEVINDLEPRIDALVADPYSAGKHDEFRPAAAPSTYKGSEDDDDIWSNGGSGIHNISDPPNSGDSQVIKAVAKESE